MTDQHLSGLFFGLFIVDHVKATVDLLIGRGDACRSGIG